MNVNIFSTLIVALGFIMPLSTRADLSGIGGQIKFTGSIVEPPCITDTNIRNLDQKENLTTKSRYFRNDRLYYADTRLILTIEGCDVAAEHIEIEKLMSINNERDEIIRPIGSQEESLSNFKVNSYKLSLPVADKKINIIISYK